MAAGGVASGFVLKGTTYRGAKGQAMRSVIVSTFGGPEQFRIIEEPDLTLAAGQMVARVSSIGINHAELMQRRGEYKIASGDRPLPPGLEAGGVIESVGAGVTDRHVGQRVLVGVDAPERDDAPCAAATVHIFWPAPKRPCRRLVRWLGTTACLWPGRSGWPRCSRLAPPWRRASTSAR